MRLRINAHYLLILPAILGLAALALSTHHGAGIGGDATIYIKSAENLLKGSGLGLIGPQGEFRLIPYFPPFFSLLLAGIGLFGVDLVHAVYWLNLFLFAALILMSGEVFFRLTHSLFISLVVELLILFSPVLIPVYSWAMSEPLAIFLGFSGLAFLPGVLDKPGKGFNFFISAVLCGLAFLTRYIAVIFLATAVAGILIFSGSSWRKRIFDSMAYFFTGILPVMLWIIIDWSQTSTVASRSVVSGSGLHERLLELFRSLSEVILFWWIPDSWIKSPIYPDALNVLLLFGSMLLLLLCWAAVIYSMIRVDKIERSNNRLRLLVLLGIFCFAYVLATIIIYLATYPPITIGIRMYAPMHVAFLWLLAALADTLWKRWGKSGRLKYIPVTGLILFTCWYTVRSASIIQKNYVNGLGYLSPEWQNSEVIQALSRIPADTLLVTNEETAVLFLTDRPAYPLAEIFSSQPVSMFTRYGDGDTGEDKAQRAFREEGAVLVLFDSIQHQMAGLYGEKVPQRIEALTQDLDILFEGKDGKIFSYPDL